MPALSERAIALLVEPYLGVAVNAGVAVPAELPGKLSIYLDLLLRWNARTNLTAIREPEEIVRRHFGESLLLAGLVPLAAGRVLDLGSGAGFPGIPMQLLRPDLLVTLAESQGKKASFLREAVRSLGLPTVVHGGRAEELLESTHFELVALRAVDGMSGAIRLASRLAPRLLLLTTRSDGALGSVDVLRQELIPGSDGRIAALCVPRGTSCPAGGVSERSP